MESLKFLEGPWPPWPPFPPPMQGLIQEQTYMQIFFAWAFKALKSSLVTTLKDL